MKLNPTPLLQDLEQIFLLNHRSLRRLPVYLYDLLKITTWQTRLPSRYIYNKAHADWNLNISTFQQSQKVNCIEHSAQDGRFILDPTSHRSMSTRDKCCGREQQRTAVISAQAVSLHRTAFSELQLLQARIILIQKEWQTPTHRYRSYDASSASLFCTN